MRGPIKFGAYIYMLECADGSYYVGLTRRQYLETRISEHEQGLISGYTSVRRPVKLVWAEHIPRLIDAIAPSAGSRDGAERRSGHSSGVIGIAYGSWRSV